MPKEIRDPANPGIVTLKFTEQEQEELMGFIPPDETPIIRYMNLTKFFSMISCDAIWFTRLDQFSDEYEGLAVIQSKSDAAEYFRKLSLASCWNHFLSESFPLWKIYLNNEQAGVAIVSTVGDFMKSVKESDKQHITPYQVRYVQPDVNYVGLNNMILATRKKNFYEYEQEIRFNYYTGGGKDFEQPIGKLISVDPHALIKKIILSPYMPQWIEETLKSIIKKYGYSSLAISTSMVKDTMLK